MWGQERIIETSSSEQEGEKVIMIAANPTIAEGAGDICAFVGKGVEFKGTITYSGTVKIDGYLDGEIHTDGVLLIGEHGDYPVDEQGRHMYPRRAFFEQIAGVFASAGRSAPVFIDKHHHIIEIRGQHVRFITSRLGIEQQRFSI